jgi:hypothetical protein
MTDATQTELEGKAQAFVRAMMGAIGPKPEDDDYFAAFIAARVIADTLGATYGAERHELASQVAAEIRERITAEIGPLVAS